MAATVLQPKATRRERWAWYLYDFGNSAYAAVVLLAVYSAYFQGSVVGGAEGSRLWGIVPRRGGGDSSRGVVNRVRVRLRGFSWLEPHLLRSGFRASIAGDHPMPGRQDTPTPTHSHSHSLTLRMRPVPRRSLPSHVARAPAS